MIHSLFDIKGGILLMAVFVVLFIAESRFALRRRLQSRCWRIFINSILAIPAFALLRFLFIPALVWLASMNQEWTFGLRYWFSGNAIVMTILVFPALDYGNYIWHILLHRIPLLWRFHLVHHTDQDMDISTAFRFHFGEMIGSVVYRGAVVLLTGALPWQVLVYEILYEAATQFHHSNTRLPYRLEKILSYLIVTPRMHGIHHSIIRNETDSNYSVILSWWDRLHHTVRLNVPQQDVVIGAPEYFDETELTIGKLLSLPFSKQKKQRILTRTYEGKPGQLFK